MSRDNDQREKKSPHMEITRDNDKKNAYSSNELQFKDQSSTFTHQK